MCTDWPPFRCHRDHLIVVNGLTIRPCLLDRPPMRSGDVRAMEDGWICRAHPRLIPVTSGSTAAGQGWRTQLPPMPGPGYPSPAIPVSPRSAAAGEQAIADHRESGPEDQPRSQHQQVGRGHPASITCCSICQPLGQHLSALGQRSEMHSACSRCDSYMKGFQPSRRDAAPDCLGDHVNGA